jgi:hypothetical protein
MHGTVGSYTRYRQLRSPRSTVVGKPSTEGFLNRNIITRAQRSPARLVRPVFSRVHTLIYSPSKEAGPVPLTYFWREGYGRITGGTQVLEMAADSRNHRSEGRSPDVDQCSPGRASHQGKCSSTSKRTAAARGEAWYGGADIR